jgi:hypothetical protein
VCHRGLALFAKANELVFRQGFAHEGFHFVPGHNPVERLPAMGREQFTGLAATEDEALTVLFMQERNDLVKLTHVQSRLSGTGSTSSVAQ